MIAFTIFRVRNYDYSAVPSNFLSLKMFKLDNPPVLPYLLLNNSPSLLRISGLISILRQIKADTC